MSDDEQWRPIEDYVGYYEVSNLGRVRNVRKQARRVVGKVLKVCDNGRGYKSVMLRKDGRSKRLYVHRLVAAAFLGPCPAGSEVAHLNHNRSDNRAVNLTYLTHYENVQHSKQLKRHAHGETCGHSKLTEKKVLEIRKLYEQGKHSQQSLANMFRVHQATICYVVNNKTWSHL